MRWQSRSLTKGTWETRGKVIHNTHFVSKRQDRQTNMRSHVRSSCGSSGTGLQEVLLLTRGYALLLTQVLLTHNNPALLVPERQWKWWRRAFAQTYQLCNIRRTYIAQSGSENSKFFCLNVPRLALQVCVRSSIFLSLGSVLCL